MRIGGWVSCLAFAALSALSACEASPATRGDGGCREPAPGEACSAGEQPCAHCLSCQGGRLSGFYLSNFYCRCNDGHWYCPGGFCSMPEFSDSQCTQRIVIVDASASDASDGSDASDADGSDASDASDASD